MGVILVSGLWLLETLVIEEALSQHAFRFPKMYYSTPTFRKPPRNPHFSQKIFDYSGLGCGPTTMAFGGEFVAEYSEASGNSGYCAGCAAGRAAYSPVHCRGVVNPRDCQGLGLRISGDGPDSWDGPLVLAPDSESDPVQLKTTYKPGAHTSGPLEEGLRAHTRGLWELPCMNTKHVPSTFRQCQTLTRVHTVDSMLLHATTNLGQGPDKNNWNGSTVFPTTASDLHAVL